MNAAMDGVTSAQILLFFGIASGALSTFAYIPYIIDTVARRTQPQRASWLIWSVLGSIALISQIYEGATSSLWFAGVQVSGTIIVFLLSITAGNGKYLSRTDYCILLAASIGLVLWYFTENAAYALAITISISLLGGVATVTKAFYDPDSETLVTWVVSLVASICAILSVGKFDIIILAYPLYLFTLYLAFVAAIILGRFRHKLLNQDNADPLLKPSFSITSFFPGVRTVTNTLAFGIVAVFVMNWLGGTSATVIADPAESAGGATTANHILPDTLPVFSVRSTPSDSSEIPIPIITKTAIFSENNEIPVSSTTDTVIPETRIIVVAVHIENNNEPIAQILDDTHPITQATRSEVRNWLTGVDKGTLSEKLRDNREPMPKANYNFPPSVSDSCLQPKTAFNDDNDCDDYILLDEDDPFAKLTVVSSTATLMIKDSQMLNGTSAVENTKHLNYGASVIAIATNGEWFSVRTEDGLHGIVHRSHVAAEALAMSSINRYQP